VIETDRLTVESFRAEYAPAVLAYYVRNRRHLEQWEPAREEAFYTLVGQELRIAQAVAEKEAGVAASFAAFEHGSEEITAIVNLSNIRRGVIHAGIIGYSVDAEKQGRGYATEAAGAVVRYAFDALNLHRLETSYHPANQRSGRVLRKLGFGVEGYARDHLFINGAWQDSILVSLINSSWRSAR
jgi:ribosomal-protein-alanine N-acetyltransferase